MLVIKNSILFIAVNDNKAEITDELVNARANINMQDREGRTALLSGNFENIFLKNLS